MNAATKTFDCTRCAGKGRLACFSNVIGGTCFKCNGSGLQSSKPAAKAVRWAVYGYDRAINEPARLYNVYAKGEQAAIAKARRTMEGASAQFKDQYSLENATAIPESEVANFPA
jgi:hypothetical protein